MCPPPRSCNNARAAMWCAWPGRCWPSACTATAWALCQTPCVPWPRRTTTTVTTGHRILNVPWKSWRSVVLHSDYNGSIVDCRNLCRGNKWRVMWCDPYSPTPGASSCCCCSTTLAPSSSMGSCPCLPSRHWKQHETRACGSTSQQIRCYWRHLLWSRTMDGCRGGKALHV